MLKRVCGVGSQMFEKGSGHAEILSNKVHWSPNRLQHMISGPKSDVTTIFEKTYNLHAIPIIVI